MKIHDLLGATDRPAGETASQGLGEAHDVRLVREGRADPPARSQREAGLDLVESEERTAAVEELAAALDVTPLGRGHDPDAHHDRLQDHPGDLVLVSSSSAQSRLSRLPYRDHDGVVGELHWGMEALDRNAARPHSGGPASLRPGVHRDLHRVVVAVVAALDLDDRVAGG